MTRARDLAAGTFEQATGGVLKLETSDTTVTDGSVLGKIEFKAPDEASGTDAILVGAAIEAVAEGTFAADNNATELVFKTGASAAADAKMTLTSGGNVGIGESSPLGKLHLKKTDTGNSPQNPAGNQLVIENGDSSGSADIQFLAASNGYSHIFFGDAADANIGVILYDHTDNSMKFTTNTSQAMSINSSGNVIINNAGSDGTLFFGGASGTSRMYLARSGVDTLLVNADSGVIKFGTNNTERMRIDSTGAVTMPAQPAFLARPASQQDNFATNTGGGVTAVAFGSEVFDQNADFSSNTFTAPVTGKYQLNVLIYLLNADLDVGYYQPILATSNRSYSTVISTGSYDLDVAYTTISQSVLADMDAGDTASVGMQTPSGGAAQADVSTSSHFSGYLVA